MIKSTYVHDNGSRPYHVKIYSDKITVYKKDTAELYTKKVLDTKYDSYYLGKCGKICPKYTQSYSGHVVLVETKKNEYIFINRDIFKFKTTEPIIKFISYVGNSDVPYSYAITKNYTYLLQEKIKLENKYLDMKKDPYELYYYRDLAKTAKYSKKILKPPIAIETLNLMYDTAKKLSAKTLDKHR